MHSLLWALLYAFICNLTCTHSNEVFHMHPHSHTCIDSWTHSHVSSCTLNMHSLWWALTCRHALSFTWILVRLSFPPLVHSHINPLMHALSLTLSLALSYACIIESCLHALMCCYMRLSSTPCAWTHSGSLPRILSCTQSIMSRWMSATRSAML